MALLKRKPSSGSAEAQIRTPAAILAVSFQSLRLFRGKYHKATAVAASSPATKSRTMRHYFIMQSASWRQSGSLGIGRCSNQAIALKTSRVAAVIDQNL